MSSDSIVSDYCRLCKISLKDEFGSNLGKEGHPLQKISSGHQNERKCFGVLLAEICKEVGLPLVQDSIQYSDRVCDPFGWKIGNATWTSFTNLLKLQLHPR